MTEKPPSLLDNVNVRRKEAGKKPLSEQQAYALVNTRHMAGDTEFDIADFLVETK